MGKLKESMIVSAELRNDIVNALTEGSFAFRYLSENKAHADTLNEYFASKSKYLSYVAERAAQSL